MTIGERVYSCDGGRLLARDPASSRMLERWYLPARCTGLRSTAHGIEVTVTSAEQGGWTGVWHPTDPSASTAASFPSLSDLYAGRKEARIVALLHDRETRLPIVRTFTTAERATIATSLPAIEQGAASDPTNVWWNIEHGFALHALGRADEARQAFERALAIDERYAIDLVLTASTLDEIDPGLGDRAFTRGMRALLLRGYEPELALGLITMVTWLGRPSVQLLDVRRDYERVARMANRVATITPNVESASALYLDLANAAAKDHPNDVARWKKLAETAGPTRMLGPSSPVARYVGHEINLVVGIVWALIALGLIKFIRGLSARRAGEPTRFSVWNLFARWTRGERIGFLVVTVGGFYLGMCAARGVAEIGTVAQAPIELMRGNLGHPVAVQRSRVFRHRAGGKLIHALALQQAGRLDEAKKLYEELPLAEAKVNLGAILHVQGDLAGARRAWDDALRRDSRSAEAAFNLGRAASSARVDRAKLFGLAPPLLAMPSAEMWGEAWQSDVDAMGGSTLRNPITASVALVRMTDQIGPSTIFESTSLLMLIVIALFILVIAPPYRATYETTPVRVWDRAFALIVPGAGPWYGPFAFLVGAIFVTGAIGSYMLMHGPYASVLDAIAVPNFARYFGLREFSRQPRALVDSLYLWGFVGVIAVHVVWTSFAVRRARS